MTDEVRLIDANALRLMKVAECAGHTIEFAAGWKACVEYCKNDAPAIEAEPVKHGRWEYDHTIGGMKHYHCTNCKNSGNECIADENEILWWEFCPRCSARMDLKDGDSDAI